MTRQLVICGPWVLAAAAVMLATEETKSARASILIPDAVGDTFGTGTPQHDILSVTTTVTASDVIINVLLGAPISAPSAFALNSIVGFIDLDADQNDATGVNFNHGAPNIFPGSEFFIDLGRDLFFPGQADVVNAVTAATVGQAPITYGASDFTVTVSKTLLGGDDGVLDYGVVIGTFPEPTDDAVGSTRIEDVGPNVVPEAGSLVVWGLLAAVGGAGALRSRRVVT